MFNSIQTKQLEAAAAALAREIEQPCTNHVQRRNLKRKLAQVTKELFRREQEVTE